MSFAPKTESPTLSPSTPDRRNTFQEAQAVPFGNGFFRVAPKWVSDRFNDHWSNGKQSGQAYCSVAGILCHGPIDFVQGIYSGGKLVAWPDIARPDNPLDPNYWSVTIEFGGADADLGPSNRMRVHWGREDQPVDSWLVSTSGQDHPPYPGQVLVVFERLHCGQIQANSQQRPALPNIELSVARLPTPTVPSGLRLPATLGAARWRGINLVSGMWDVLTHPRAGAGMTSSTLDEADWIAKATALESGSKPAAGLSGADVYVSPLLTGSAEVEKVVLDGLSYIDGWFHTVGGKIRLDWYPNDGSAAGTLPEISEHDMVEPPKLRTGSLAEAPTTIVVECLEGDSAPNDLVEAAETANVPFVRELTGETSVRKLQRPWFTSREIGGRYASRAAAMATIPEMDGECRVHLHRAVRLDNTPLRVGDRFLFNYGPQSIVVQARLTERLEDETTATLRWKRERGVSSQPYVPAADPRAVYTLPDPPTPGTNDWTIAEAPRGLSEIAAVVALVRRPSDALSGLRLYLDEDNNWVTGATLLGAQGFAARVTLSGTIASGATSCTLTGTDPDVSPTLSSGMTATEQADDTLIMLMGTEWMSLGSVVSAGAGAYTVGLSRGRLGSTAAGQTSGAVGWVIRRDRVTVWSNAVFAQLATRYFKVAYYHALADGPLSAAKSVTFADRKPGAATSFAAVGLPGAIKLTWVNPNDVDLLGVQIYESSTTTQPPSPSWFVAYPGNAFTRDDLAGGVTKYFWIVELDQNINVSTAVGPISATTTSASAGADGVGAWTPLLAGTATTSGGSIFKKTGTATWDASVYSQEGYYRGAAMATRCGALGDVAFGLDASPAASASNTTIDYAFRLWAGGQIDIVENGSVVAANIGTQVANTTVFQIVYDNAAVRYYVDGVLKRTVAAAADQTLYLDSSLYTVNASLALLTNTTFAAAGAVGSGGLSSAVATLYKRAATAPAVPTTTSTWTFSNGTLAGHDNGWTQAIPAVNGQPLWATAASAISSGPNDTIAAGEWASPVKVLEDGAPGAAGLNTATVWLYQRASSSPAVPAFTTTWEFANAALTGTLGSWTQTIPAGSNPIWVTTATAASTGATDNIATGEWATPRILAQDGATGATGATGSTGATGATGPGYGGTSSTSHSLTVGSKTFTIAAGMAWTTNTRIRFTRSSDSGKWMEGYVTSYSGTSLTVQIEFLAGTGGPFTDWTMSLAGQMGTGTPLQGPYNASSVYIYDSVRRDLVSHSGRYYAAKNPAKNNTNTWITPAVGGNADWEDMGTTYSAVATKLLLAEQAIVTQTFIMGDGTAVDGGIFRSHAATLFGTGSGYYMNPRSSAHSNGAVFRVGDPAASQFSWTPTTGAVFTNGSGNTQTTIDANGFAFGTRFAIVDKSGQTTLLFQKTSGQSSGDKGFHIQADSSDTFLRGGDVSVAGPFNPTWQIRCTTGEAIFTSIAMKATGDVKLGDLLYGRNSGDTYDEFKWTQGTSLDVRGVNIRCLDSSGNVKAVLNQTAGAVGLYLEGLKVVGPRGTRGAAGITEVVALLDAWGAWA